ncbi:MAG: hypothetical protein ABJD53_09040 [Gammaproteobacteria bacterium]
MTAWGHECGENRVARLMRAAGIVAPNLLDRQFEASAPMGCFDNTSPRAQT